MKAWMTLGIIWYGNPYVMELVADPVVGTNGCDANCCMASAIVKERLGNNGNWGWM